MKRVCKIMCLVAMMALLAMPANAVASEGPDVDTWFTWKKENGEWHDWVGCTQENKSILYNLQLKVGQPVKCKVNITPSRRKGLIWLELTEPGTTNAYTVTSGNKQGDPAYINGSINESVEYEWTLKPNGKWTGGNAPINIYWQILYAEESDPSGSYAFADPTIIDEEWQGGDGDDDGSDTGDNGNTSGGNNGGGVPGFEAMTAIAALGAAITVAILSRKKTKK